MDSIEGSGSVTADCKVIGSLYQSQSIQLNVSNISGISSNSTMKWILNGVTKDIDCDATHCWNNSMNAPSVPGNYDYVLTYNEKTVCAGTVEIGSALTCAVSPNELNKGEEYSFTAHRNINCWNCYYQFDNGTENNIQFGDGIYDISLTKTATNLGNKTLSLNCTCNGNIAASCSQEITINDVPPSFSCPDNLSFEVNSSVTITPTGVTGCESGCDYEIPEASVQGSSYTGGALQSFTAPSTAGTFPYTIVLKNDVGPTPKTCNVKFIEAGAGGSSNSVFFNYNDEKTFESGKTYSITCALQDGSLRSLVCKTLDNSSHKFTYNGAEATANPDYWAASATCQDGEKTLITSKNIMCKYMH